MRSRGPGCSSLRSESESRRVSRSRAAHARVWVSSAHLYRCVRVPVRAAVCSTGRVRRARRVEVVLALARGRAVRGTAFGRSGPRRRARARRRPRRRHGSWPAAELVRRSQGVRRKGTLAVACLDSLNARRTRKASPVAPEEKRRAHNRGASCRLEAAAGRPR